MQERAAMLTQLAEPPDAVPRWHRSNALIGAGPTGYVYQVRAPAPAPPASGGGSDRPEATGGTGHRRSTTERGSCWR